jgi:hypothetical protein
VALKGKGQMQNLKALRVELPLLEICKEILEEGFNEAEWAERESADMFQKDPYCGGFDADEKAFCFSYYEPNGPEYWFQITLEEVAKIHAGSCTTVSGRLADSF